jgi:hypothetical protein
MNSVTKFVLLTGACILASTFLAPADNRIIPGTFEGLSAGSQPPAQWIISKDATAENGVTVQLAELPGASDGKLWVHIHDQSAEFPAGMLQNFATIQKGRFAMKIYFQKIGKSFGIYLGSPKVAHPDTRAIDIKMTQGGKVSVGVKGGEREKIGFSFVPNVVYSLFCDFEPVEGDAAKLAISIGLEDTGEVLYKGQVATAVAIAGLRLTTDSTDVETDAYVTDITLQDKP